MYESPIHVYHADIQHKIEGEILTAVMKVGVTVDKDELLRALQYDRGQYEKGYADAMKSIVRCKDCKRNIGENKWTDKDGEHHMVLCMHPSRFKFWKKVDDFCSDGERRTDGNSSL